MKLFTKDERSSFSYWFAHWCAFNMVAILCNAWKFKYLFHDIEKPWLMLLFKGDYKKVQEWHRKHNKHHLDYPNKFEIDWEAWAIDNECGRFTKVNSPLTAKEYYLLNIGERYEKGEVSASKKKLLESNAPRVLRKLNIW